MFQIFVTDDVSNVLEKEGAFSRFTGNTKSLVQIKGGIIGYLSRFEDRFKKTVLLHRDLTLGIIVKEPLNKLVEYHIQS